MWNDIFRNHNEMLLYKNCAINATKYHNIEVSLILDNLHTYICIITTKFNNYSRTKYLQVQSYVYVTWFWETFCAHTFLDFEYTNLIVACKILLERELGNS